MKLLIKSVSSEYYTEIGNLNAVQYSDPQ